MIDTLLGPLGGLLAGVVAVLAALVLGNWRGASRAKSEAEAKAAKDALERTQDGRDHVARNRGDDPVDRVRRNDGQW